MKIKHFAFALPLALSTAAFAADSSSGVSVYYNTKRIEKWEVTPGFTFGSIKTNYDSSKSGGVNSITDSLFNFSVGGEYGINEMISVGLKLGYQTDSFSTSPSQKGTNPSGSGMTDPVLYVNGKNAVGPGTLRSGALLISRLARKLSRPMAIASTSILVVRLSLHL